MGRRKREEVIETVEPMVEDAMNAPEEAVAEESRAEDLSLDTNQVHETVEPLVELDNSDIAPLIDASVPVELANEPIVAELRAEPKKEVVEKTISTSASRVNVRKCADGDVLFTVANGSKVLVEDEHDGWSKITGYVMTSLLK